MDKSQIYNKQLYYCKIQNILKRNKKKNPSERELQKGISSYCSNWYINFYFDS